MEGAGPQAPHAPHHRLPPGHWRQEPTTPINPASRGRAQGVMASHPPPDRGSALHASPSSHEKPPPGARPPLEPPSPPTADPEPPADRRRSPFLPRDLPGPGSPCSWLWGGYRRPHPGPGRPSPFSRPSRTSSPPQAPPPVNDGSPEDEGPPPPARLQLSPPPCTGSRLATRRTCPPPPGDSVTGHPRAGTAATIMAERYGRGDGGIGGGKWRLPLRLVVVS